MQNVRLFLFFTKVSRQLSRNPVITWGHEFCLVVLGEWALHPSPLAFCCSHTFPIQTFLSQLHYISFRSWKTLAKPKIINLKYIWGKMVSCQAKFSKTASSTKNWLVFFFFYLIKMHNTSEKYIYSVCPKPVGQIQWVQIRKKLI